MLLERLDEYLEEYLDGGLDAAACQEVEARVAGDPAAARRLAGLKSQRALRAATYETYMPTKHEAAALAARMLAQAYDAPAGRIGYWVRRGAAVAAVIALVAGTFAAGRMTATPQTVESSRVEIHTVYNVVYTDVSGIQGLKEFATVDERDKFVKELELGGATGIAVADLTTPGHM